MVGSAICRLLKQREFANICPVGRENANLTRQQEVELLLKKEQPEYLIVASAKVGGIIANNNNPADFIYENLMIQTNLIHTAYLAGVKKLLFIGSSCIYPKFAPQPIKEARFINKSTRAYKRRIRPSQDCGY